MKRKILVFSHEFPPQQGGEGTYAYELACGLNKLDFNVFVLAGTTFTKNLESDPIDSELLEKNIKIERYDWVKKDRFWFISWKKIFYRYLKKNGPFDHIFFANFTSCVIGHRIPNNILPSYSITLHGDDIDYFFTNKKWRSRIFIKKAASKTFFGNAKKIICVSNYTKEKLNSVIPFKATPVVIYHGVEPREIEPIKRSALELEKLMRADKTISKDKVILIYIARLVAMKGQDKLIRLLGRQRKLAEQTHTFIVGGGSQHLYLKRLVEGYNISRHVTFTGEIPREEVMKYLSFSDILIFLSDHPRETFGIVILEAMLMKKPVIVLNHGGMVEAVQNEKNGFVVDVDDIESKLWVLISNNKLRKKMGEEGRRIIENKFNNKNMALESVFGLLE